MLYSNHSHEKWYSRYTYGKYSTYPFDCFAEDDKWDDIVPSTWIACSWLPDGCYIQADADGALYEAADCLIDEHGNVYGFDYDNDAVYPLGGTAYTSEGAFAAYDEDDAEYFPVTDVKDLPMPL